MISMQQQHSAIQKLHNKATSLQSKLDTQINKLQQIQSSRPLIQAESYAQHYVKNLNGQGDIFVNFDGKQKRQEQFRGKNGKELTFLEREVDESRGQIQELLEEYNQRLEKSNELSQMYTNLRQKRKSLYEQITNLKAELHKNRQSNSKYLKMEQKHTKMQEEYKMQIVSVAKLQKAANNYTKLQYQMNQKLKELQNRQFQLIGKLDKQKQSEIQISGFWVYYEKWEKLMQERQKIRKYIDDRHNQCNKYFVQKLQSKQSAHDKVKSFSQMYEDINVTVKEQEYIIKQIMSREGIKGYQLTKSGNSSEQEFDNQKSQRETENQISVFRNQIGMKGNFNGRKAMQARTEPMEQVQQIMAKQKIRQIHDNQNQMRMTAKISKRQPKRKEKIMKKNVSFEDHRNSDLSIRKRSEELSPNRMTSYHYSSSLPKIASKDYQLNKKSIKKQQIFPITHHMDQISPIKKKRASFDTYNKDNKSHASIHPKLKLNIYQSADEDFTQNRQSELRRNMRVRTKDGYRYSSNDSEISYKFPTARESPSQPTSSFPNQKRKHQNDIVNLYEKMCQRRQDYDSEDNQIGKTQDVGGVRLKLTHHRKKKKMSYKQLMESRQSDTEGESAASTVGGKGKNEKPEKKVLRVNVKSFKEFQNNVEEKGVCENQEDQIKFRQRLKTIHQGEQDNNIINSQNR